MTKPKDPGQDGPKNTVHLNTASLDELALTSVIGEQRARGIVDYRNSRGSIRKWDELDEIPGFTPELIQRLKREGFTI